MLDVTVLLLNDNYPSTAIGPIEVFHSAGRLWNLLKGEPAEPRFRVTVASLDGKAVTSPYSVQLLPQASIDDINRHRALVGPGPGRPVRAPRCAASLAEEDGRPEMPDCRLLHGRCLSCGGRPLDGREATTHWATADEFRRRYPKVNWRPENFITEDRRMLCSGGVYSSMDLSLYLVEKFCGHEVAPPMRQGPAHQHAAAVPVGLCRPASVAAA
jgi:transcriptional regulator GlxA family with amidase domain